MKTIPTTDLEHVLNHTNDLWKEYFPKGSTIFITGGTGFFGKWILESFIFINEKLHLNGKLIVLSRDPENFLLQCPQFNHSSIIFLKGDIRTFIFPEAKIDFIVHAATAPGVSFNIEQPLLMFDTIVDGTKNILELAKQKKVKAILHTSSGAVYGKQPSELTHVSEEYIGSPDIYESGAAYGEGKRVAEMLCNLYFRNYNVPSKVARCFAFAGPYLPLDGHFAVGNFIKNILDGAAIKVNSDGTAIRSYMYAADLTVWLFTVLFKGNVCHPYNVGSEEDLSIEDVAKIIASFSNKPVDIQIAEKKINSKPLRYVPSTSRAKQELNLQSYFNTKQTLQKTFNYYLNESK